MQLARKGKLGGVYLSWSPSVHGSIEVRYLFNQTYVYRSDRAAVDKLDPDLILVAGDQRGKVRACSKAFEVSLDFGGKVGIAQNEPLEALPIHGHKVEVVRPLQAAPEQARQEVANSLERVGGLLLYGALIGHYWQNLCLSLLL